jgi:DNA invertase Pin-like site-specific DNA recombinase
MKVALSARVSSEEQARAESASIDQQLADMRALCERNGWEIAATFVDCENYLATQAPNKGKMVNPSGERADRPGLLALLDLVRSGDVDAVLCWRDDRLVRHPRVAVALEDALDVGDARRNGRGKIGIFDATGGQIDRFTLSIKASIWREENKRRTERVWMGKRATLEQGRWPGVFNQFGYTTISEEGKRGRAIILDPEEAETVKRIFDLYEAGYSTVDIRRRLVALGAKQKDRPNRTHDWSPVVILKILKAECYTGRAVWRWADGKEMEIEIPQIVTPEQWARVQERVQSNKQLATRHAMGVYLLQGLLRCGECGGSMGVRRSRKGWRRLKDGTVKNYVKREQYHYQCRIAALHSDEGHPRPYSFLGKPLDWAVWRTLVDQGITQPKLLRMQVLTHQEELQRQGESVDGDIAHARQRLGEVDQERTFYLRQAARDKITEAEFDAAMQETEETRKYWQAEINRLTELRDDAAKVQAGLDYVDSLLSNVQARLPGIDQTPEELAKLPEERRDAILSERQVIIRALVKEVRVWHDGRIKIIGMLDGTEGGQFELLVPWRPRNRARLPGDGRPAVEAGSLRR